MKLTNLPVLITLIRTTLTNEHDNNKPSCCCCCGVCDPLRSKPGNLLGVEYCCKMPMLLQKWSACWKIIKKSTICPSKTPYIYIKLINPATCFGYLTSHHQGVYKKVECVQLQSVFSQGWDLGSFYMYVSYQCKIYM